MDCFGEMRRISCECAWRKTISRTNGWTSTLIETDALLFRHNKAQEILLVLICFIYIDSSYVWLINQYPTFNTLILCKKYLLFSFSIYVSLTNLWLPNITLNPTNSDNPIRSLILPIFSFFTFFSHSPFTLWYKYIILTLSLTYFWCFKSVISYFCDIRYK